MSNILRIPSMYAVQTGRNFFDYEHPETSTMDIEDIANALSNICRWGGHCQPFFSVLQHELMVHDILIEQGEERPEYLYAALHHDDHEAVRGDIPTPRKRYLKLHRMLFQAEEANIDKYIYSDLLGIQYPLPQEIKDAIKQADMIGMMTERQFLKPPAVWHEEEPAKAVKPLDEEFFNIYVTLDRQQYVSDYLDLHYYYKEQLNAKAA